MEQLAILQRIMRRNLRSIVLATVLTTVAGTVFTLLLFREQYRSEATLLLAPVATPEIITSFHSRDNDRLQPGNTLMSNHLELLRSRHLADLVYTSLRKQKLAFGIQGSDALTSRALKVQNVRGTDFIRLVATWTDPKVAQAIVKAYLDNYKTVSLSINREPLSQQRMILDHQLTLALEELAELTNRIRTYQETHQIVSLDTESRTAVEELDRINREVRDLESRLAGRRGELRTLQRQLNMDAKSGIQAVAGGLNTQLVGLYDTLSKAEEDLAIKSLTYSQTNPDLIKLKERIAILRNQIDNQTLLTVGRQNISGEMLVRDGVRADLIKSLAQMEAETSALSQRLSALYRQREQFKTDLASLPEKQETYSQLLADQKNKELIVDQLKQKLAEARIQEAVTLRNFQIIDPPVAPQEPIFPKQWHLIALSAMLGLTLSTGAAFASHYMQLDSGWSSRHLEKLEKLIKGPVLGRLPWLPENKWREHKDLLGPGDTGVISLQSEAMQTAYRALARQLVQQGQTYNRQCIAFAALSKHVGYPVILANVAGALAELGHSVLIMEGHLRHPRLHKAFNQALNYDQGLPELVNTLSDPKFHTDEDLAETIFANIQAVVQPTPVHANVAYLNPGIALDNPAEYLDSPGFGLLLEALKHQYHWILIDAPPLLGGVETADTYALLSLSDGAVVLTEHDATEEQAHLAGRKLQQASVPIVGSVVRLSSDVSD